MATFISCTRKRDTAKVEQMFADAKLSDRHERLFGQIIKPLDGVVTPAFLGGKPTATVPASGVDDWVPIPMKPGEVIMMNRLFAEANEENK